MISFGLSVIKVEELAWNEKEGEEKIAIDKIIFRNLFNIIIQKKFQITKQLQLYIFFYGSTHLPSSLIKSINA